MNKKVKCLLLYLSVMEWVLAIPTPSPAADDIQYRLKWLFNTSVVGDLYADVQGYFEKEGLKVTVKAGGPEKDAIREIELGHSQFGVASADQVIRAMSKGSPVVVVAQLFQVNPLQWIYRADQQPIQGLADLKGRVIGITFGGNDENIMRTLMAAGGIAENEVTLFSVRYDFTPFYQRKADIWPVYRNSQGPILTRKLRESGEDVRFFNPADFGVEFVANSVVTSERMLTDHPDAVRRFTRALLSAWRDALDPRNADKAIDTLRRFDKDTPEDLRPQELDLTRELVKPSPQTRIGEIDTDAWRQTETMLVAQKLIPQPVGIVDRLKPQQ